MKTEKGIPTKTKSPMTPQYFLDKAKDIFEGSYDKINSSSENIISSIKWLFGLLTSGSIGILIFGSNSVESSDFPLLTIPLTILLLAYVFAVFAKSLNFVGKVYPEAPELIKEKINRSLNRAKALLLISAFFMLSGFVLFPFVIVSIIYKQPNLEQEKQVNYLNGYFNLSEGRLNEIAVIGQTEPLDTFRITVYKGTNFIKKEELDTKLYLSDSSGNFSFSQNLNGLKKVLDPKKDNLYFKLTYRVKDEIYELNQKVNKQQKIPHISSSQILPDTGLFDHLF